jgi:hypothetical protein
MITANVFDIKRSPSRRRRIRTTIFLKGCPLSLQMVPESRRVYPEISLWYCENTSSPARLYRSFAKKMR